MKFPARLQIPDEVLAIARTLDGAGHAVWCVGGAVRDNLLRHPNHDFDLATSATPREVQALFRRTVPIGFAHGTVAVLDQHGRPHEVTTFRRDVTTDGRHAEVQFGVSLEEDLARRDFTINAIAYHPISAEWRDPYGGAADLDGKVVRAVGDPGARFREDYLRILRALRFAARFGFTIDGPTWEAARVEAKGLAHLSAERVRDEWFRGLATAEDVPGFLGMWCAVGAVRQWLPEAEAAACGGDPAPARALAHDPVLLTAWLSSDPAATLQRLRCSNAQVERGRLVGEHRGTWPDAADPAGVRRWLAAVGPAADDLVVVARVEGLGEDLPQAVAAVRAAGAPLTLGGLAVSGADLLALGLEPGPAIGRILRTLLDEVLEEPGQNDRDRLLARARALAAEAARSGDDRKGRGK